MTIVRLPPAARDDKPETARERQIRKMMERIVAVSTVRTAAKTLADMGDRWDCNAYAEMDYEELDAVLNGLIGAERTLNKKLANGAPPGAAS